MNKTAIAALTIAMASANCQYAVASESSSPAAQAQRTANCTGTVLDENGEPLIGAAIHAEGQALGVSTDADGKFTMPNLPIGTKLVVSYVGYKPKSITFQGQPLNITMDNSSNILDEVVVVAYGTQKKSSITGAISQVDAKSIESRPVSSVTSALEGSASGITVTGSYGQPGAEPTILIRGIGTVNGSTSPLYVVDGVPYGGNISDLSPDEIESMSVLKDAASCALYGNRASNGVILITTKKSTEKRPTFTFKTNQGWYQRAIPEYDRVGVADFMEIEYKERFNSYVTAGNDPADAHDYVISSIIDGRFISNPFGVPASQLYTADGKFTGVPMFSQVAEDCDWMDQAIKTGYRQEYLFSGAGGGDNNDYYFAVNYLDENGYMEGSGFTRINGRGVVNITPRKWFKTGLSIQGSHQKLQNTDSDTSGSNSTTVTNPFYAARVMAPIYPVHLHDAQGNYILSDGEKRYDPGFYNELQPDGTYREVSTRDQLSNNHPIWENELNQDRTIRNTINGTAYADFLLPQGFTVSLKGNINTVNSERSSYRNPQVGSGAKGMNGSLSKTIYNRKFWTFQQQLRWNKTFDNKYSVNVLLGHENYSMTRDYTYNYKTDVKIEGIMAMVNFNTMSDINGYRDRYRTESYLGRVQLNIDERYNLEGSFRRDGSSRFSKENRWGNFGSVGANWVFSGESFMKDLTWLNFGKLRVNWGQVGNDAGSGYYSYYDLYASDINGGSAAYYINQIGARDLCWETGESWGVGLETRLFNRWNFAIEYYDKRNKDLIFDVYNPISGGGTSFDYAESTITRNLGTMSNTGIEINTDIDIYTSKDWTFNLAANLTTLKNKIVKLPEQNKDGIISGSYKIVEGKSRYEWYMYHWAGVDMMDGNSLYDVDLEANHIVAADGSIIGGTRENGELVSTEIPAGSYKEINGQYYVNNTTFAKRDFRGSTLPTVYGSFTPTIRWKDLTVSSLFTYSLGGKIIDYAYYGLMSTSSKNPSAYHVDMLNSWDGVPEGMTETSPNRINSGINPRIDSGNSYNNASSDRMLISRNYFNWKNLNVTYRLPRNIVKALDLTNVQLGFSAENLIIHTKRKGMNAQQSLSGGVYNSMPPAKVYTFNVTLTL